MKKSIQNTSNVNLIMIDEKLYQERLKHIEEIENKIYNSEQTNLNNLKLNIINLDFSWDLIEQQGTKVQVNKSIIPGNKFLKQNKHSDRDSNSKNHFIIIVFKNTKLLMIQVIYYKNKQLKVVFVVCIAMQTVDWLKIKY